MRLLLTAIVVLVALGSTVPVSTARGADEVVTEVTGTDEQRIEDLAPAGEQRVEAVDGDEAQRVSAEAGGEANRGPRTVTKVAVSILAAAFSVAAMAASLMFL